MSEYDVICRKAILLQMARHNMLTVYYVKACSMLSNQGTIAQHANRRLVSSVDRVPVCCAGGRGFEPQTISENGKTFKSSRIRTINRRPSLLHLQCNMISRGTLKNPRTCRKE